MDSTRKLVNMAKKLRIITRPNTNELRRPKQYTCVIRGVYVARIDLSFHPKTAVPHLSPKFARQLEIGGVILKPHVGSVFFCSQNSGDGIPSDIYALQVSVKDLDTLYLFFRKDFADQLIEDLQYVILEHQMAQV